MYLYSSMVLKKGNVANQREHLILLLANMDIRNKNLQTYTHVSMSFVLHGKNQRIQSKSIFSLIPSFNRLMVLMKNCYPVGRQDGSGIDGHDF